MKETKKTSKDACPICGVKNVRVCGMEYDYPNIGYIGYQCNNCYHYFKIYQKNIGLDDKVKKENLKLTEEEFSELKEGDLLWYVYIPPIGTYTTIHIGSGIVKQISPYNEIAYIETIQEGKHAYFDYKKAAFFKTLSDAVAWLKNKVELEEEFEKEKEVKGNG